MIRRARTSNSKADLELAGIPDPEADGGKGHWRCWRPPPDLAISDWGSEPAAGVLKPAAEPGSGVRAVRNFTNRGSGCDL